MAIEFERQVESYKMLDPTNNFEEKVFPIEFRADPLTRYMGLLVDFRVRKLEKPDLPALAAKSLETGCPFCPGVVEKVTPKFTPDLFPEGRIKVGEAIAFPNAMPYLPYSALTVIGSQHFVSLPEFSNNMLIDGFIACQKYFERVIEYDPAAKYCFVNWNFMPPASSSQLHPHVQTFVGYSPLPYYRDLLEASQSYHEQNGTNYWSDLIAEEKRLDERYIGVIGDITWLTSFVPRSWRMDVAAIFMGKESLLALSTKDIEDFCSGLRKVFAYMDDQNEYSFNLGIYSGVTGDGHFWTQARIVERAYYPPLDISDAGPFLLLLDTMLVMRRPEEVCKELKPYFD